MKTYHCATLQQEGDFINTVVRRLSSDVTNRLFCSSKDTSLKAIIGNPKPVLKEFKCIFSLMNNALNWTVCFAWNDFKVSSSTFVDKKVVIVRVTN
jgi:hypothetical protein